MTELEAKLIAAVSVDTHEALALNMIEHHRTVNPSHYCAYAGCDHTTWPSETVNMADAVYKDWEANDLAIRLLTEPLLNVHSIEEPGEAPRLRKVSSWAVRVD